MEIRRTEKEWLVRWVVREPGATATAVDDGPNGGCAFCDDDGAWIALRDFVPMPRPSAVRQCDRCGTVTATATLPVVARRDEQPATRAATERLQPT